MPLVRKPADRSATPTPESSGALKVLVSGNEEERWAAARSAAEVAGGADALAAAARQEESPRVREAIFTSLARIGTPASADHLLALLRSDNANLRTGALDALRMMPGAVREFLPRLLSDPDVDIRVLTCELTRSLSSDDATYLLSNLLAGEQDVNVCAAAIDVLAEVGNRDALPALAECTRRFHQNAFLTFAIQIAADRINNQPPTPRG